jgi:uncharacterized membrane protein YbhN (UPF0104 family)
MLKHLWLVAGLLLAAFAGYVLWKNLDGADLAMALRGLVAFPASAKLSAIALVFIALVLASLCEIGALQEIRESLGIVRPVLVTAIANPIGHALILPTLSGGAIRYRMYSAWGLSAAEVAKVTVFSALPFVLGVTILLPGAVLVSSRQAAIALHVEPLVIVILAIAALMANLVYVFCTATRRPGSRLPGLRLTLLQAVCGVIEILTIGGALYVFMPGELGMSFPGFLVVYLIGILLGQFSSVPAGIGMLEASLVLLLPHIPKDKLIAAALAYRVVFDVLPLIVALALLALFEAGSRRGIVGRWWRAKRVAE